MGFFDKIFGGLTKTRRNLEELEEIFQSYKPDNEDFYDELEELLVMSDVGAATAAKVVQGLKKMTWERRFRYGGEAREGLIEILTKLLNVGDTALKLDTKPSVILMVGVNGVGKTTTIGKLAGGQKSPALRGRHLPCRRGRAAGHLGGALRGGHRPPRGGQRSRRRRV